MIILTIPTPQNWKTKFAFVAKRLFEIFLPASMVKFLCPHCEGEIELEGDASGEFESSKEGEFEWNVLQFQENKICKANSLQLVSHQSNGRVWRYLL